MRQPFVAAQPAIVMTRVWLPEHEWLHTVFACSENQAPTFRFPDLLSACVALTLAVLLGSLGAYYWRGHEALKKSQELASTRLGALTGGMKIPGLM